MIKPSNNLRYLEVPLTSDQAEKLMSLSKSVGIDPYRIASEAVNAHIEKHFGTNNAGCREEGTRTHLA